MKVNNNDFDWKWYVSFYPDLLANGIDNEIKSRMHYKNFGRREMRAKNSENLKLLVKNNLKTLKLLKDQKINIFDKLCNFRSKNLTINILTRTACRPKFFEECRLSILNQTYKNIRHIVGFDDIFSNKYLSELSDADKLMYPRKVRNSVNEFPYNLYLNNLNDLVDDGWIMYLDDDDLLINKYSLEKLSKYLVDEDALYIWKVWFPNKIIPSFSFGKKLTCGEISGIGFTFHSKHRDKAVWRNLKGGDFDYITQLSGSLKVKWINMVLTGVNYKEAYHANDGNRIDRT